MTTKVEHGSFYGILAVAFFICSVLYFLAVNCAGARDEDILSAARASGLRNVRVTGYALLACSDSDTVHREVFGTTAQGQRVKAAVCCGVFKGCTVRWVP